MKIKNPIFSPQTKLAGMLERDPSLLDVLDRLGIRLGFGESTLGEAAEKAGLDPETTCLICNVYTFEDYKPGDAPARPDHRCRQVYPAFTPEIPHHRTGMAGTVDPHPHHPIQRETAKSDLALLQRV